MSKRMGLYARVSTSNGQTVETQLRELRKVAERAGWEVVAEYTDEGVSGAKGRDKRPQFDALLKAAVQREFDLVAAWSVDRLGRSLQDLVAFLSELQELVMQMSMQVSMGHPTWLPKIFRGRRFIFHCRSAHRTKNDNS